LIIRFTVQFPKTLTPDAVKLLEKALPRPAAPKQPARGKDGEDVEEVALTAFVPNDGPRQGHRHREAYEEDDDDHPQQGVSCAQQ
jgi:hypothetical protein